MNTIFLRKMSDYWKARKSCSKQHYLSSFDDLDNIRHIIIMGRRRRVRNCNGNYSFAHNVRVFRLPKRS